MSTAEIRRIERQLQALEEATQGRLDGPLGELHDELSGILIAMRRDECLPTREKLHNVPAPKGTPFERTFTGSFIGKLRRWGRG